MRQSASIEKLLSNQKNGEKKDKSEQSNKNCRYFEDYSGETTPFDIQTDTDDKEDLFSGIGVRLRASFYLMILALFPLCIVCQHLLLCNPKAIWDETS